DLVGLGGSGGEYDHRQRAPLADLLHHFDTVHVWQAELPDHQVGPAMSRLRDSRGSRVRLANLEAVRFQAGAQEAADLRVVLDRNDHRCGLAHADLAGMSSSTTGGVSSRGRVKRNAAPRGTRFSARM